MAITKPEYTDGNWNCAWSKTPINFGLDAPVGYAWAFDSVIDVDGKAAFTNDIAQNIFTTPPPCKYFYTPAGLSPGLYDNQIHVVTSIGTDGTIYTTTDYVGDENRVDQKCLINLTYQLFHAYPEPTAGNHIDIKPLYKIDGTLIVNLSEYLKSIFTVPVPFPVSGFDENMYSYFRVKIVGSQDFIDWCTSNSLTAQTEVDAFTGWDWDHADNLWYVIRGCIDHEDFNTNYTGVSDLISAPTPIYQAGGTIVSKILANRVYNIFG